MKKVTLLCGMLLAITATVASAASGVNLRWTDCFGDLGAINRTSTCLTNAGNAGQLVGSFEMNAAGLTGATGVEIVVDVATAGATLPAWWQFKNAGTCRIAQMSVNPVIGASAVLCLDWSAGAGSGGLAAYNIGSGGPNTARMIIGFAVPAAGAQNLLGGQEYFDANILIKNGATVGLGSCPGCEVPACIICNSVKVATPPIVGQPSRDVTLSGPTNGTDSNFALWQGGGGVIVGTRQGCPAAVPTHNSTWSQVKTLYR